MTLKDKIFEAAQDYIQREQGVPAIVQQWRLLDVRHHQVIARVMVTTDQGYEPFEVWVLANLDTEEVGCV